MLDGSVCFKRENGFRCMQMNVLHVIWIVLAGLATVWGLVLGVPFWLAAGAFACVILPPIVGMFVRGSATDSQAAELEAGLWVGVATLATASTGGATSPLVILFAAAVATAWSSREARLTAEIAGFCLLGYALATIASLGGAWISPDDRNVMAAGLGLAGLIHTGLIAAFTAARPDVSQPVLAPTGDMDARLVGLEARLRDAEAAHDAARADAEASREALDRRTLFFAQTSHELRTPLNAISGFADMMRSAVFGPLPPKYQEYAELIREGGRNLELVVDDVLDLSRIDAGRYDILPEPVSLTDLAEDAVRFMSDLASRRKISLEVDGADDAEAFADTRAVRQIALNLISNALKFTPEGGTVRVSTTEVEGGAVLAVSDTGVGISPEELTRLSRAFEQGEAGRKQKGAGLGLSVVRAFAELHGGRLDIDSREGGGTTIAVFFPEEKPGQ